MSPSVVAGYRLSPQQEHLWRLAQEAGFEPFCTSTVLRLQGDLDLPALRRALHRVTARHEILRTSFPVLSGMTRPVVQVIGEDPGFGEAHADLTGVEPNRRDAELAELVRTARAEDAACLGEGPRLSALLVRTGEGEHYLVLTLPAWCTDRRSLDLLEGEILASYAGREPDGEVLQYALVADWFAELLEGEDGAEARAYWRGFDPQEAWIAALPFESRADKGPFRPRRLLVDLGDEAAARLRGTAQELGAASEALCLAAWSAFLGRLTERDTTVVAVRLDARSDEDLDEALGPISREVPLAIPTDAVEGLRRSAERLARRLAESADFVEGFEWDAEAPHLFLPYAFEAGRVSDPASGVEPGNLRVERVDRRVYEGRFHLKLEVEEGPLGTRLLLHYDAETIPEAYAEHLGFQLSALLGGALAAPDAPLGALPLSRPEQMERLTERHRIFDRPFPRERGVHHLFLERAEARPDRTALEIGDERWSYGMLRDRSLRIAAELRSRGVGPDRRVALYLERSCEMVAAMIGVMAAGGAYVPVAPQYPAQRTARVIADAGARWVLTTEALAGRLPRSEAEVLRVEELCAGSKPGGGMPDAMAAEAWISPEQLVYVLFTSGSSGRPKGVMLGHAALTNLVWWLCEEFELGEDRVVFQKTAVIFDASMWELFAPLVVGARMVLAEPGSQVDPRYLARICGERAVTDLQVVPSLMDVLLAEPHLAQARSLRYAYCGGEAVRPDLVTRFQASHPARFTNFYGPTELTINILFHPFERPFARKRVPLGRPVANNWVALLDPRLRRVPVGVPGEIVAGGENLARGYLGLPAVTAESFIPDPFPGRPGGRAYRTGDLGRFLPDGEIEFMARRDHQVKVRGYRIELEEIESVLAEHPAVAQAVVAAHTSELLGTRLAAYVVPIEGMEADRTELEGWLRAALPEYMVPSAIVSLPELPRLSSGKIDRASLPEPGTGGGAAYRAPRTPTEELVAQVWCEVLGLPLVGRDEDFFALGGHSLLATQLTSRLSRTFGVRLSLRTLFEDTATVASLAVLLDRQRSEGERAELPPIERAARAGDPPLSAAQQRLWFLDQLVPGNPVYNLPVAVRLEGPLVVRAMARSLREIVCRHEVLRTRFPAVEGRPVQRIHPPGPLPLPLFDLSALPEVEREEELRRRVAEEALRPFDLAAGPLFRASMARLDAGRHLLLVNLHHTVGDGWSLGVLVREIEYLYGGFAVGASPRLPDLPIQYADFAAWQRGWLDGPEMEGQVAFWRELLGDEPPPLSLPTDRPRPSIPSFRGANRGFRFSPERMDALRATSRQAGATLFMTSMAAVQALFFLYAGEQRFLVGSPIANRTRPEIEELIGSFANMLALPADLGGRPTFRTVVERVKEAALGAYLHQDLPFERLVEALQPSRELSRTPLFQVAFGLQNAALPPSRLGDLELMVEGLDGRVSRFDLLITLLPAGGGSVEYSTDLFDETTIERLIGHFDVLTSGLPDALDRPVAELAWTRPAERHQVLREWNDTRSPFRRDVRLEQLFEARARLDPEAVAVIDGAGSLTYGELDAEAGRLAALLASSGVGPGRRVAVRLGRSREMVRTLLAVLKAGAAYVPVESSFPPARAKAVLDALAVRHLVTDPDHLGSLAPLFPELPELEVVVCPGAGGTQDLAGELAEELAGRRVLTAADLPPAGEVSSLPASPPGGSRPEAEDPAYYIFTSGSTGVPKGVMEQHRPVVNLIEWVNERFDVGAGDRILFTTSLGFDLSVYDIFGLLAAGGSIRVASEEERDDPQRLLSVLVSEPITFWDSAPAALQQLVPFLPEARSGANGGAGTENLRRVFLSGDWVPVTLPGAVRRAFPRARVVALGGATEATIWSNFFPADTAEADWVSVPYGRPIDNARYHVLGPGFHPCPTSAPGDLFIGGECLASGYAGDPALTASKFVPDPWSSVPGGVLYRTGDRARFLADGNLQFLGRRDHQVKIRGYRIELGEVASVLAEIPGVADAVAVVREDAPGGRGIVAYMVGEEVPAEGVLLDVLRERLPEYMLPAALVRLAALPMTPNGKLDRGALPAPEARAGSGREPGTEMERRIAALYGTVLGVEGVAADDDFFRLGGHSLVAVELVARIRSELGASLPLAVLFERPTVAALAAAVEDRAAGDAGADGASPWPEIAPDAEALAEPFPLNAVQQAYWLGRSDLFELGRVATHSYAELEVRGLDLDRFTAALRTLIDRHAMLRALVLSDGRQRILPEAPDYRPEVLDFTDDPTPEERLAAVREEMSHQILSLDAWPLFDIRVTRLRGDRQRLHVSLDALILDAWSLNLLGRQLADLYQGDDAWQPFGLSFRDYVLAEDELRSGPAYRAAEEYWERRLDTLPPAPELPLARSPDSLDSPRFVRRRGRLEAEDWRRLRERGAAVGLTPSGLVAAAFAEVLSVWSKKPRFTLNLTLFNRLPLHPDVDRLVGDFTSLVLLEIDASDAGGFEGRARRAQAQLWRDLEHRLLSGVEVLRRYARRRESVGRALMPVVLTSTLSMEGAGGENPLGAETIYGISQTPQVWLDHQVFESEGALVYSWDAVEELFPPGLLDDLFGAYTVFLESLASGEEAWRGDLRPSLLPPGHLVVQTAANATAAELEGGLLHDAFFARAAEHPEAPALLWGTGSEAESMSYGELAARARREAAVLLASGAAPGERVGVVMEKGWEQVAAVLGISAAGCAYLPVGAELPSARRTELLRLGGASRVLTQEHLATSLELPEGCEPRAAPSSSPEASPAPVAGPWERRVPESALAYVIFTSGSTGRPKGVAVEHRSARNTVADVSERFGVGPSDRVLSLSSLSFDLSVYDVFGVLGAGGALVLPEPSARRDPSRWLALLAEHGVTLWNTVPALLRILVEYAEGMEGRGDAGLRLALLSGDWIPLPLPDRARSLFPGLEVVSLGGATEASIWSIAHHIGEVEAGWRSIPYGRPLANQSFEVVDSELRPRPLWVPGELVIGGVGLARGYQGEPGRTASAFVPAADPGPEGSGARWYRTGDLGRRLPDGSIEFLGREDGQVKIRGNRIELGEVEAALCRVDGVREAVAAAREDETGQLSLVGYVVGERPVEEVAEALCTMLPEAMIPTAFVRLEALPITRNGKLDRRALPAPEATRAAERRPPATELERRLAAVWEELLGVEGICRDDDFFQLGGHSLVAARMVARIREDWQQELSLRDLFENATLARLARCMEEPAGTEPAVGTELPGVIPDPERRHEPFPLNAVQEAYWVGRTRLFELGGVSTHSYLELESPDLDLHRLRRALDLLIERHDMLRAVISSDGRQRVLENVPSFPLETRDLRGSPDAEEALQALREEMSHQVIPADRWPLFDLRASLLDGGRTRLHVGLDALIGDAWSFILLGRQLGDLYDDPESVWEPPGLTFRDYVLAEERLRSAGGQEAAWAYWEERLDDLAPAPALPLAANPAALASPRFERRAGRLEPEGWDRLRERAADAGITPSAFVLTAFALVLSVWAKSPRFTLNVTLFNRLPLHPDVDRLVGDFTSLLLLEVDTAGAAGFERQARLLQGQLWRDLEHREVSGVEVLRRLARRRGGSGEALMPVVLTSTLTLPTAERPSRELVVEEVYGISQTPQVWLDHQVGESEGALVYSWDAVEELFPPGLLDELFGAYTSLLEALASGEEAWRRDLRPSLLPPDHREVQRAANDTAAELEGGLLHDAFFARAAESPEATALLWGTGPEAKSMSYGELAARARREAAALLGSGAAPGERVGVVMEKGWEQVVAVLGISAAGCAYLPVGAELPPARRGELLRLGGAFRVLTQEHLVASLELPEGSEVRAVPEASPTPAAGPAERRVPESMLAYVIFTSGSTGRPKGVAVEHRSARNTVADVSERFGVGPSDRVLGLSSLSFDLSVYDVFGVLGAGGALVLPEPSARRDPSRWLALMAEHGVTLWNTVPALLRMLVEYGEGRPASLPSEASDVGGLRLALLSGDWIPLPLPDRARSLFPGLEVVSLGGATEASVWSITHHVGEVEAGWRSIPYGRPLANQSFEVVDSQLRPRPLWVPGELVIGGVGLARGYQGEPGRTASAFVPAADPGLNGEGARWYRTGDLGRRLPDGSIEFLGREDGQVKIQGYRVELGEVEAALGEEAAVAEAAVLAPFSGGARRLVACVVPAAGAEPPRSPAGEEAGRAPEAVRGSFDPPKRVDGLVELLEFKMARHGLRRESRAGGGGASLPPPDLGELAGAYHRRRTHRSFAEGAVALEQLGCLLGCLLAVREEGSALPRYRYPSAGSLYPVQAYVWVREAGVEGLEAGFYYYDPDRHHLAPIRSRSEVNWEMGEALYGDVNQSVFRASSLALFLVARREAIEPVYGASSRDFCLLEAGYMGQLLMETAASQHLGLCPIGGGVDFGAVQTQLIDEVDGELVHSFLGGRVEVTEARAVLPVEPFAATVAGEGADPDSLPGIAAVAAAESSVGGEGEEDWTAGLAHSLGQRLPAYMVPDAWVVLGRLPLTSNGKVDRRQLERLAREQSGSASPGKAAYKAPTTEEETCFAELWQELLGRERVGVDDSFFDLGGDSVRSIQFLARAEELGWRLEPRQVFELQTLGAIAAAAERIDEDDDEWSFDQAVEPAFELGEDALERLEDRFGAAGESGPASGSPGEKESRSIE